MPKCDEVFGIDRIMSRLAPGGQSDANPPKEDEVMKRRLVRLAALWSLLGVFGCSDGETGRDDGGGQDTGSDAGLADQSTGDSSGEGIASCVDPGEVKVLFLVDTSGSLQFTDPGDAAAPVRQRLLEALIAQHQDQEHVSFGVFTFNSKAENQLPAGLFTRDDAALAQAVAATATADLLSDFESALQAVREALVTEMAGLEPFQRSSTRYVVVLLSDGGPNPICTEGCDNDPDIMDGVVSWCDIPRDQWCENSGFAAGSEQCLDLLKWFPGLEAPCLAYNSWPLIQAQAEALAALKEVHGLGALDFFVVNLIVADLSQEILELMGLDPTEEASQLQALATAGSGSYLAPMINALDLAAFDLSSLTCMDD